MTRKLLFLMTVICLLSCNSNFNNEVKVFQGEALGTTYSVKYFSESEFDFKTSMDSIVEEINSSMSTYITNSDISKINRGDTTVVVDQNFINVFQASKKIYEESNGFFDPTVGILVNAYGFGPGSPLKDLNARTLDSLTGLVGLNKIQISPEGKVSKKLPAVYLDFNAIAKGYTIDVIADYLNSRKVDNYLIELGGELRANGKNLDSNDNWIVGIDDPLQKADSRELTAKVQLVNSAMATSGNYRKFRVDSASGQQYVHTVNPITGFAEKSNLLSASVLAKNCMLADGYATALMAMGLDRSKDMVERVENIEVYLIYSSDNGDIRTFISSGFQDKLVQ